jgi:hypothetical protein
MIDLEERIVAKGVWLYDGIVPRLIEIRARPARFAGSRFKESEEDTPPETPDGFVLDENTPIPDTPDGLVYSVGATAGGQFNSLEDARSWADAQPWGPVKWD